VASSLQKEQNEIASTASHLQKAVKEIEGLF
jgi:hypothetical protein